VSLAEEREDFRGPLFATHRDLSQRLFADHLWDL